MNRIAPSLLLRSLMTAMVSVLSSATVQAAPPDSEKTPLWREQSPVGDGKFEMASGSITVQGQHLTKPMERHW